MSTRFTKRGTTLVGYPTGGQLMLERGKSMRTTRALSVLLGLCTLPVTARAELSEGETIKGKRLDAKAVTPGVSEDMDAVAARAGMFAENSASEIRLRAGVDVPAPREIAFPGDDETEGQWATQSMPPTASLPVLHQDFVGLMRSDDFPNYTIVPDPTIGVGPDYVVEVINRSLAVYAKSTGNRLLLVGLANFFYPVFVFTGNYGDPRVLYDQHSGRWVVIMSDFNGLLYLAVSHSSDPMGSWFKSAFVVAQPGDNPPAPDYPTLGVDGNGIYSSSWMGGSGQAIVAIHKQPLIAPTPSLGTVTIFRNLSGGTIQAVHTYGNPGKEYLVSRYGTNMRLWRVNPPLTNPTLTAVADICNSFGPMPNDAEALGSPVPIDTLDGRLMNAVYRNGSVWTCHTSRSGAGAACRWYEVDVVRKSIVQKGTVSDPSIYFYNPSIAVNSRDYVVMGFTGSSENQYACAYYSGRSPGDAPGAMGVPVLFKAGEDVYQNTDSYGRNRWGDYSGTAVDPSDDWTIWTLQEYAETHNPFFSGSIWGTWMARFGFDCNGNGVEDNQDLPGAGVADCNNNLIPDVCESPTDCNQNGIQDICDVVLEDCNHNGVPDECDDDCDGNGTPDSCQSPGLPAGACCYLGCPGSTVCSGGAEEGEQVLEVCTSPDDLIWKCRKATDCDCARTGGTFAGVGTMCPANAEQYCRWLPLPQ